MAAPINKLKKELTSCLTLTFNRKKKETRKMVKNNQCGQVKQFGFKSSNYDQ